MPDTKNRRIHFFDVRATAYDPQDRKAQQAVDVDPLFAKLQTLKYQRGGADSSVVKIWGEEMVGAVDIPTIDFVAGRFSKVRRTGLPGVVSPQGYRRIRLADDEGLYEASHFVYFRRSRILAMEFNAHAPQARLFSHYLKKLAHVHTLAIDDVELVIKVDPDTIGRLRHLGPITQIQAAVASTQAQALRNTGRVSQALKATAGVMDRSFNAEVTLTRERPRKHSPRGFDDEMKRDVIELWTETGDILTSLKVKAEPVDGGEPVLVDFKRDRFSAQIEVDLVDGTLDSGDLYAKIIKHFGDSGIGE